MISCPFCRTSLAETVPACPRCQLDLQRANALLGPVPSLSDSGLTDFTASLAPADEKTLRRRVLTFHQQFPQCRILIVIKELAPQFPLGVHLFWLFNSSGLSGEEQKHGRNRDILIGLDPVAHQAGLIVGYGLEPFLPQNALEQAIDCASPHFKDGRFGTGLITVIDQLSALMEGICSELPAILGLDHSLVVDPSTKLDY